MTPEAELEKMKTINRILYLELKDYKIKNKELLRLCRKMEKQLLKKPIRKSRQIFHKNVKTKGRQIFRK